jgi:tRNA(fMet)-specific endonuclease VapC
MIRYLLDTNTCIYLIKKKPEHVIARLKKAISSGVGISSITLSELEYGVQKSSQIRQNAINLLKFVIQFEIMPYDENAARHYGIIRADLEKQGNTIGNMDMLIGSHARALEVTLVTNNEREFTRIKGLALQNWARSDS